VLFQCCSHRRASDKAAPHGCGRWFAHSDCSVTSYSHINIYSYLINGDAHSYADVNGNLYPDVVSHTTVYQYANSSIDRHGNAASGRNTHGNIYAESGRATTRPGPDVDPGGRKSPSVPQQVR